jgi:hypothetical protein
MFVPHAISGHTRATAVKTAVSATDIDAFEHVIVPVAPTAGVAQDQPAGAACDTKRVCGGRGSVTTTFVAVTGPLFVAVIV